MSSPTLRSRISRFQGILFFIVPLLLSLFPLTGCLLGPQSHVSPFVERTKESTSELIAGIREINQTLETCKGTGWITLKDEKGSNRFRLAWAAVFPDKIRISLLSAGHPIETIVADGRRVIFISHTGSHPVYTLDKANPSLKKVLTIPVSIQDLIAIFTGKIPLRQHDVAQYMEITYGVIEAGDIEAGVIKTGDIETGDIETGDIETGANTPSRDKEIVTDRVLLLKKGRKKVEKVVVDSGGAVTGYSIYDIGSVGEDASSEYTVLHREFKRFEQFLIPVDIQLSDRKTRFVEVEISRYFPNIPIKESTFDLTASI